MRSLLCLALVLACGAFPVALWAQDPTPDPLADIPAELRTKVDGIMDKAAEAKHATFARKMQEATAELVKATGLSDPDALKTLAAAAHDAEDASVRECITLARQRIGRSFARNPQQMTLSINITFGTGGLAAVRSEGETPPDEQPGWTAAVRAVLPPEQFAAWSATLAEADAKEKREIDRLLDTQVARAREEATTAMTAEVAHLVADLELPPDRAEKLGALGREAVEKSLQSFRLTAARTLRSVLPVEQRQRMIAANQVYFTMQGDDAPTNQTVWKQGLESLLTAPDRQRLRDVQELHRTRRVHALGSMLLATLDESVAFTAAQRGALQDAAERAVRQETSLVPADETQNYYQFTREAFLAAAARVPEAEARAVIDPAQWQHWQAACKEAGEGSSTPGLRRFRRRNGLEPAGTPSTAEAPEAEDTERQISDGLDARAKEERRHLLAATLLKTEDAARTANLDEKVLARLRTAARGTAEATLALWKANVVQNLRAQLENGDPNNLPAILASLGDFQLPQNSVGSDQPPTLYDKTVERELNAPQRDAWRREVDARAAYRDAAVGSLILAEFDRRYQLTSAQWDALQGPLARTLQEYGPDIRRMFGYSPPNPPWYFQNYAMFLPLVGIPEEEFKDVLGPERWERWSASQENNNGGNYWRNVLQYHKQRHEEGNR